jgi:Tfp pilus assembly protein PilZ
MENHSEKRQYERYAYQLPVSLYRYDSQDSYYEGSIYNYSDGGMYFATNEKIDIGEQVYIKIKNHNKNSKGPEKYENYSGYLKWSSELGTSSPGGQYGYGIGYAEPVYY